VNGESKTLEERLAEKPKQVYKETPEYREALMHPKKGKMEERIVQKLRAKGYKVTTDEVIYVVPTIPDANIELSSGKIAHIYIDGVYVHDGKQKDKDDSLRKWLKLKEPDSLVIPVDVKGTSVKEEDAVVAEIEESLKW
jgi:hypothetical protein